MVCAGLDQDYLGRPFEPVPQLMAVAEHVTKLHAICVVCGAPANHSQRIVEDAARVLVGEAESYEPRCRAHFEPEPRPATPPPGAAPAAPEASEPASGGGQAAHPRPALARSPSPDA